MPSIKTYVFIDLEATSLPKLENNQTKITELSFVAVSRQHFLATRAGDTPRVQSKITLCFNPRRIISLKAASMSGLTNKLLEEQPIFDSNVCRLLELFFSTLAKPVCLVSHGGNYLDYPVLMKHFKEAGANLPEDIRCIDSLDVFYCLMEGDRAIGTKYPYTLRIKTVSYKLQDVYMRLLKRGPPEKAHSAEADCITTLQCAVVLSTKFVDWVDLHSGLFSKVKPL